MVEREPNGNTTTERVPQHNGRLFDLECNEQIGDPLRVAAHREVLAGKIACATEAGHCWRNHLAALCGNRRDHALVGVVRECPPVQ